jgi:hypothetical protein
MSIFTTEQLAYIKEIWARGNLGDDVLLAVDEGPVARVSRKNALMSAEAIRANDDTDPGWARFAEFLAAPVPPGKVTVIRLERERIRAGYYPGKGELVPPLEPTTILGGNVVLEGHNRPGAVNSRGGQA